MSGYYPPNQHIPPQYYHVDPNALPDPNAPHAQPMMPPEGPVLHGLPEGPMYQTIPGPFVQYGEQQLQQGYLDPYENVPGAMEGAAGAGNRMRRRPGPGDHVKHRRTRSGCFTCRNRRVKCDETHPICERCRKGGRECVYPEPPSSTKSGRSGSKSGQGSKTTAEAGSSPEDHDEDLTRFRHDEDAKEPLSAIPDEDEEYEEEEDDLSLPKNEAYKREASDTPALTLDKSPSPSTEASSTATNMSRRPHMSRHPSNPLSTAHSASGPSLPKDVKFYLEYFKNHMSHHHYSLKRDSSNFLKTAFLDMVYKHEPLRYAVVGYAAYFHTLSQPDGRMSTFLQYYNESVSRLRQSIEKSKKQSLATFLTILQLASIEELLGDWVNLMIHQKAAYEILTRLYTPQTITKSELLRKVSLWYVRFDLFVGFQSGGEAVLGREWYVAIHEWYGQQAREHPDNITFKYEERFAWSRLIAKDNSDLFSRKARGLLTDEEFMIQLPKVAEAVAMLDKTVDPTLLDPKGYVKDLSGEPDPDDIVNPYEPNAIWGGEQWTSNHLILDMYGIIFMFNISISMALKKPFDPELTQKAYRAAQIFEAVCAYDKGPSGSIIEAQASLAIATLFLPKDPKTIRWCRRTFCKIESAGYIYSNTLRNRMLEAWGLEHSDWWLPNDEGCPPIIRSIKNFVVERTTAPKDQTSQDLREMRGIFSTLTITDSPPSDHAGHTPMENVLGSTGAQAPLDETVIYTTGSPDYVDWSYEQSKYLAGGAEAYGSGHNPGH